MKCGTEFLLLLFISLGTLLELEPGNSEQISHLNVQQIIMTVPEMVSAGIAALRSANGPWLNAYSLIDEPSPTVQDDFYRTHMHDYSTPVSQSRSDGSWASQ